MPEEGALTVLFQRLREGDSAAREELVPLVYAELHRLARCHMARQAEGHTLQPTALVHEAYLKLCRADDWHDRKRFLDLASTAMRQLLVDHARRKRTLKRGGAAERVELEAIVQQFEERSQGLVELDEALERLRRSDPQLVRLVELRFFGGSTMEEAAEILGISVRQASRWWAIARAALRRELDAG